MIQKLLKLVFVFLLSSSTLLAQEKTVSGTIVDQNGFGVPGANVVLEGTSIGSSSDFDGNYSIEIPNDGTLVFSSLGFATQSISTTGQTTINVTLIESAEALSEVVVTALGISRERKSLGYAVSQLDGDDVSLVKETNVASSLAGKVAGVVVSKSTSGPGGGTRVVIRGNGSITGNNQPLYVVDGIPINNEARVDQGAAEFSVVDLGTGISDINPDDIESMSVLKGPNAAALYGSRAANGVILITTKKGALNKGLGISYTTSAMFDSPLVLPEYQNEYGRGGDGNFPVLNDPNATLFQNVNTVKGYNSWGPQFDGSSQLEYNGEMRPYSAQPDNVKDFFETGSSFVNTIAVSNGTENSSIFFSWTNSDIQSILPNSGLKRNNFNLRGFTKLSDKMSFDGKVTYFLQDAKNRPTQGTEGIGAYLYGMPRNISLSDLRVYQDLTSPIHNHPGADEISPYDVIAPNVGNPYWLMYQNIQEDNRSRITGFAKLDYQFNDWLSAFIRVGTDAGSHDTKNVIPQGYHFFRTGRINYSQVDGAETNYDFLVTYDKDLSEKFDLTASVGGNMRHNTFIESGSSGEDFKIPGKYFLDNTDGDLITASQGDEIKKKVHSLYGQASVSYNDMVYLDLTGRNDWSSALAEENRSYFYSSQSLSVLLHNIFDLGEKLDFLKVRGSTANVGNDTGPQQIVGLFNVAGDGYLGNIQVDRPSIRFSESLKPEDIRSTEVGFEFRMLKSRLYGDFSYYSITTKDLIFDVPVDPGTGYEFFRDNVGKLTNKGYEILLGGKPIQNDNFSWDVSANISHNDNKLESLIDGQDNFTFSSSNGGIVDVRAQVGGGYGDIYTTTWKRNDAGQLLLTEEGRPQATSEREKFGNYQPDYTGGVTNTFNYKNWTLNFLVDFRIGGEVFSYTDSQLDAAGVTKNSLQYREGGVVVEGVYDEGTTNPGATNTTNISGQDYWGAVSGIGSEYVYDQSNARLRELSLTYRVPKEILDKTFIRNASLSFTGRNLFFLWKKTDNFDPESSYSTNNFSQGVLFYALPTTKSLGLSLNVNF
ncbi:SusC/RagA family TonB-linked outer membrane protein [Yeosuana sp. MJ-SS3]|uniref:SusC/RagA family TonB-linked outer membrane protein n=1 Tax=Gilvirhabdus luticola TaxID=3079858 RepID=A0ABU3U6S6_9FLAO|nr:SusC/RagA family TonB-linked outer membrane protein [Yeosuana sp. MJ-SS3]MDU8886032.1 SusC/RagA family TonB-linked outer membrane protein [Yeosuana sp. MJ-SS3]